MGSIVDRKSKKVIYEKESKILEFLYNNRLGRIILKVLVCPFVSKINGFIINSRFSKIYIKRFIKKNNINVDDYIIEDFSSFNDFFIRKVKPSKRKIGNGLISVADSKLMVYDITENATLHIKHSTYNLEQLLYDKGLAKQFINGKALVFRLDVSDYHRYLYFDEGKVIKTKKIDGILNTVKPIAFQNCKVFIENAREYQVLNTQNYGKVVYMEVGALNVGKVNNYKVSVFKRGMEKGYFSFGGSTIVLLFQEGMARIDKDILDNSSLGRETIVKYGESIGK